MDKEYQEIIDSYVDICERKDVMIEKLFGIIERYKKLLEIKE